VRKRFAPEDCCFAAAALLHAILRTSSGFPHIEFPFAGMLGYAFLFSRGVHCVMGGKTSSAREVVTVIARQFAGQTDAEGFPKDAAWETALAIRFEYDWQGTNADPQIETEVRLLWSESALYVRFLAHFRSITVLGEGTGSGSATSRKSFYSRPARMASTTRNLR
jgi:hypothetical protein